MDKEPKLISRRRLLGDASALGALGILTFGNIMPALARKREIIHAYGPLEVHQKFSQLVRTEDIMALDVPEPGIEKLRGAKRGLIIDKTFHRFWLYEDGALKKTGAIGTADKSIGKETPEGFFHVFYKPENPENFSSTKYPPKRGGRPNMRNAVFFNEDIGTHEYTGFHTDAEGKEVYKLDGSHGCVHMNAQNAVLMYETLQLGDPVLVTSLDWDTHTENKTDTVDYIQKITDVLRIVEHNHGMSPVQLSQALPDIPSLFDIADEDQRRRIFGMFEHSSLSGRSPQDPVVMLKRGSGPQAMHGNAIRTKHNTLLTVHNGTLLELNQDAVKRALADGIYKDLLSIGTVDTGSDEELHGSWAIAFGYHYNGNGDSWTPQYVGGVLVHDTKNNELVFVTNSPDMLFEEGMPLYVPEGRDPKLVGLATRLEKAGTASIVHLARPKPIQ